MIAQQAQAPFSTLTSVDGVFPSALAHPHVDLWYCRRPLRRCRRRAVGRPVKKELVRRPTARHRNTRSCAVTSRFGPCKACSFF